MGDDNDGDADCNGDESNNDDGNFKYYVMITPSMNDGDSYCGDVMLIMLILGMMMTKLDNMIMFKVMIRINNKKLIKMSDEHHPFGKRLRKD